MMYNVAHLISRAVVLLVILALATARPQHFGESNQEVSGDISLLQDALAREYLKLELQKMAEESDGGESGGWKAPASPAKRQANNRLRCYFNPLAGDQEAGANAIGAPGMSDGQLELLAQKLAEYNNQVPSGWDPRWERIVRAPEMKRQSRFRQCYFNPVSCFKK